MSKTRRIAALFVLAHRAFHREIKVIISPRDFRKNATFPRIEGIDWEEELYEMVRGELQALPG